MKIDYPHRSKFVKILEESLRLNRQKFADESIISVELTSGGYPGEVTVIIGEDDKEQFDTDWTGNDVSRFPVRIKAAAEALKKLDYFGNFKIIHDNGILKIARLPHAIQTPVLVKKITKSQHTDGVRINKAYHDHFNSPKSKYHVAKGESRNIIVYLSKKEFTAKYLHENPKSVDREMQSIRFSKELMEEFQTLSPDLHGSFSIELGADLNQFVFKYIEGKEEKKKLVVNFDNIEVGKTYDRPFLAKLWGYTGYQAISKGVVTPKAGKKIVLFVTKEKQKALTQYNDFIDGDLLFWEGEEKHGTDQRIINAKKIADDIHLFYREIHHSPFEYYGLINLLDYQINKNEASEFIFKIEGTRHQPDVLEDIEDHNVEFKVLKKTEQESIVKSRIGQGDFRKNLIKIWGRCAVTGVKKISILKASHIKPWRVATNQERVDPYNGLLLIPNLDELFDAGIISFADDGSIMISRFISLKDLELLNIHDKLRLRKIQPANELYLRYHRQNIFEQ